MAHDRTGHGGNPQKRPESLTWVEQTLGRGARVVATRLFTGGLTSPVHELTVLRNGRRSRYVLRSWAPENQYRDWILRTVAAEAAVLTALERSDVPAPRLIASTGDVAAGGPALLMTRVPGRVFLMPRHREHWLRQMAQMLARIHALDATGAGFESWLDAGRLTPPADASRTDIWREAFALVAEQRQAIQTCFIHRDYQHFNLLWSRERLPGGVEVGTVDKFQGREAPIVFFSMASSTSEDIPRGLEFLFSRNRLNVAISRARALAVLVCSPQLLETRCNKIDQMRLVNNVCRLAEDAGAALAVTR